MPKMHQNTFVGRVPPGPAGGAYASPPDLLAAMGPTRKGKGDGGKGRGLEGGAYI